MIYFFNDKTHFRFRILNYSGGEYDTDSNNQKGSNIKSIFSLLNTFFIRQKLIIDFIYLSQ